MAEFEKSKSQPDGKYPLCNLCCEQVAEIYREEHYKKTKEINRVKYKSSPKRLKAIHRRQCRVWKENNKDKVKKYNSKRLNTLKGRLCNSLSTHISVSLSGNKNSRHWETLVDFTIDELKTHLESKFKNGMTWDNYGRYDGKKYGWEIDHILPICSFNFEKPEDVEFKQCWSLKNLQPLWAKDNRSKGGKVV